MKKVGKNRTDIYTQNKDISCLKKMPPNVPELFNHNYNLENINNSKTYGEINNEKISIIFYNHLMLTNCKYFKSSITTRNKKKMLTVIYYTPKK